MSAPANHVELVNDILTLTREIAAPRALVFEVWSTPEHLSKWFGPDGFTSTFTMDFRSGGAYTLTMEGMGMKHTVRGIYREVVVPERIVQRFEFDETPGVFITTSVTFTERAGKTLLDVRQEFPARDTLTPAQRQFLELAMAGAPVGWSQTIDHLVEYVTR